MMGMFESIVRLRKGFIVSDKAKVVLGRIDGNIYSVLGATSSALKKMGLYDKSSEMIKRATSSSSYEEALCIIMEYVDFVEMDEDEDDED